ncbi:hypothetical protein JHK87_030895 [Glycine soja]|nr:hypothetical protein JHK87_030895 [Glycine soja]
MKVKTKRDDAWTKERSEDGLMMMLRVLGGRNMLMRRKEERHVRLLAEKDAEEGPPLWCCQRRSRQGPMTQSEEDHEAAGRSEVNAVSVKPTYMLSASFKLS